VVRVLSFILVLALAACSSSSPDAGAAAQGDSQSAPAPGGAAPDAAAVQPVPAELPDVIARVNGQTISRADFERAVRNVENRPAERDRVFRRVLDDLIGYRLLVHESQSRKVAVSDADVEASVGEIRQQFPSEEAFTSAMAQQQLTAAQVRSDARQNLGVEKLLEMEIASKTAVTPDQIAAFYKENPQAFQVPEQVRASHILISVTPDADAPTKAAARAKAESVLKSAKGGADFAALAREHSQDPGSAAGGGDLGVFRQGQMVGPFNDVAFKLAPGAISDVVETDFGYHIIKVVEKQPARAVALDEARGDIERHLQQLNRQRETQAFVQSLRSKSKIEVFI
jgi:peptidyl-prolyl cis-trans isomerase C